MKRSKYGNKKTEYNGFMYDSASEAVHASALEQSKKAVNDKDRVLEWTPQVTYRLEVNGRLICKYIADFVVHYADGRIEVQDVKSEYTRKLPMFKLKQKLMKACLDIDVILVIY